jgi:hypothetical protein
MTECDDPVLVCGRTPPCIEGTLVAGRPSRLHSRVGRLDFGKAMASHMASQIVRSWTLSVLYKSTSVLVKVVALDTSDNIRRTGGQSWNGG